METLPKSRSANIVVQNLQDETLIYDLLNDKAYCLNKTSAEIFDRCDGVTTFAKVNAEHRLTDEIIYLALDELKKLNLIAGDFVSPFAGLSRRDVIKKVGLASMIALPVIVGIVAPSAAGAASNPPLMANGATCSTAQSGGSRQCESGYCVQTTDGLRCCTAQSTRSGIPNAPNEILGGPAATCDQRAVNSCCSGKRATQFGNLCVCS